MTSAEKLAEFKAATKDRATHPDKAQRLWEEFIELVEKESHDKGKEIPLPLPRP